MRIDIIITGWVDAHGFCFVTLVEFRFNSLAIIDDDDDVNGGSSGR